MDWYALIIGALGLGATILQTRGKAQYAKALGSVVKGVEAYSQNGGNLKATIKTVAATEGAQELLHATVKRLTK